MEVLSWPFQPVIDGSIIPDMPLKLWCQPELGHRLPAILTGFCSHEGADFVLPIRPLPTLGAFFRNIVPEIDVDALEAMYPTTPEDEESAADEDQQLARLVKAYGDYAYICPVIHTAHMASKMGSRAYLYEFAALNDYERRTAGHCAHSDFARPDNNFGVASPEGLQAISREMHKRWASFISSPDGRLGQDMWPAFDTPFGEGDGKGELLVFGEGNDQACGGTESGMPVKSRTLTEREREVCKFWWDRIELSQGMGRKGTVDAAW